MVEIDGTKVHFCKLGGNMPNVVITNSKKKKGVGEVDSNCARGGHLMKAFHRHFIICGAARSIKKRVGEGADTGQGHSPV